MKKNYPDLTLLRCKAESRVNKKMLQADIELSKSDTLKLIHELEVFQMELQMQNEELVFAKAQVAILAKEKYDKLYDFAPSGFFTLSTEGEILELNLCGSQMLGKERIHLNNSMFGFFVSVETRPDFNLFLSAVFENNTAEICELEISAIGKPLLYLYLTGITSENGKQCLITAVDITARKLAEKALNDSNEYYRLLFENSGDAIFFSQSDGIIYAANPEACRISGRSEDEIRNLGRSGVVDENDPRLEPALEERRRTGHFKGELNFLKKDGSSFPVEMSTMNFKDGNGNDRISIFARDITDRKKAEELIKVTEQRFSNLVHDMRVGVVLYGPNSEILLSNPKALELLDITKDQLSGKALTDPKWRVIDKDGSPLPDFKQIFQKVIASRESVHDVVLGVYRPSKADMIWLLLNAEPRLNSDGKVKKVICTFIDISKRKQAEEELLESEQRLKYHFENSPLGVVEWNSSLIVTQWSKEAEHIFGWKMEEVIGRKIDTLNIIYEKDIPVVDQIVDRLINCKDQMVLSTNRNFTKRGDIIDCSWYNSILLDKNGQMKSVMSLVQDITERKQSETAIIQLNEQLEERIFNRTADLVKSNSALLMTEEKYRTVADFTYDWEYWINADGNFIYVSPSCERITGFTSDEFIQDSQLLELIIFVADMGIWEGHKKDADTNQSGEMNPEFNFRIVTKAGVLRWICCVSQNIFVNNKYLGIRASNRDITDKINAENELLNITIEVEERERNHFSRELHDGLGPLLSAIKVYFQWLAETDDDAKAKIITEKGNKYIDSAIQTTHEVALGLSSLVLNNSGYVKTVLNYAESVRDTQQLNIDFTFNSDERFGYLLETTLYRITTELINNTVKYAKATKVNIMFNHQKGLYKITLSYIDNGKGFDLENVEKNSTGLGLLNIRKRVNILKGLMQLETSPGNGLKIYIELPVV